MGKKHWLESAQECLEDCLVPVRLLARWLGEDGYHAINVFRQFVAAPLPERVKQELHAFSSGELCSRYEIDVASDQDDRVHLAIERHAGDIQPDARRRQEEARQ